MAADQIEGLWRILQPADPEYKLSNIKTRTEDITPLVVLDKNAWLSELNSKQGKVISEPITKEWIVLFEQRALSEDKPYEVPYCSRVILHSCLLRKGLLFSFKELDERSFCVLKLQRFDDNESITLDQARDVLTNYPSLARITRGPFFPILALRSNSPLFFGYTEMVSLPSYLIDRYGLTFKDFDLYDGYKCVVKYEVWQEGYEDESYSRDLLSFGIRLLIHKSLLQKIFQDYGVELCQSYFEKRLYYKTKYNVEPTEKNSSTAFVIIRG